VHVQQARQVLLSFLQHVFNASTHGKCRITQEAFDCWMRIMERVPNSVLWMYKHPATAALRLVAYAAKHHPTIARERLVFSGPVSPKVKHVQRLKLADLYLDTLTYNGHTTGSDVLWAGVPMVTMAGTQWPSRVGASLCKALGLEQLIVSDLKAYEDLAVRLAMDTGLYTKVKNMLVQAVRTRPLFDADVWVESWERSLCMMVDCRSHQIRRLRSDSKFASPSDFMSTETCEGIDLKAIEAREEAKSKGKVVPAVISGGAKKDDKKGASKTAGGNSRCGTPTPSKSAAPSSLSSSKRSRDSNAALSNASPIQHPALLTIDGETDASCAGAAEAEAVRHGDAATAVAAEAPASAVDEQSAVQVILYELQPPSPASQSIIAHAFPHPGVVPWPHSYSLSATRRRASIR
jgi:hypothetical protein